MTIALGFNCYDGIVLCADSEMSKGESLKFKAPKIHMLSPTTQWLGDQWVVITAYAGFENIAARIQQLISSKIASFNKDHDLVDRIQSEIETVLTQEYRNHRKDIDSLQMLYAISVEGESRPSLLRSWGKVVTAADAEYAGTGDSSVIRFLSDILCPNARFLNTEQALMICLYMVSKAKKYVGGCGQDTHAAIIRSGTVRVLAAPSIEIREKYFGRIETSVAEVMRSLFDGSSIQGERVIAIQRFSEEMSKLGTFTEIGSRS